MREQTKSEFCFRRVNKKTVTIGSQSVSVTFWYESQISITRDNIYTLWRHMWRLHNIKWPLVYVYTRQLIKWQTNKFMPRCPALFCIIGQGVLMTIWYLIWKYKSSRGSGQASKGNWVIKEQRRVLQCPSLQKCIPADVCLRQRYY